MGKRKCSENYYRDYYGGYYGYLDEYDKFDDCDFDPYSNPDLTPYKSKSDYKYPARTNGYYGGYQKKRKPVQDSLTKSEESAEVIFSEKALTKMLGIVMLCDKEVGWHGVGVKKEKGKYLIEDIFLYPQTVTGATIKCDDSEYGLWQQKKILEDPDKMDKWCFHGHSHVNMGTSSSGVDKDLQDDLIEMLQPDRFYIFMIINKSLSCYFKIADREDGLIYEDVKIDSENCYLSDIVKEHIMLVK